MLYFFQILVISLLLVACGSGSSSSPVSTSPVISYVLSDIRNFAPSYGGVVALPYTSLKFVIRANVSDPQGAGDIEKILLRNEVIAKTWDLYDLGDVSGSKPQCTLSGAIVIECILSNPDMPHSIRANDWELVVRDREGNEEVRSFSFKLPGGEEGEAEAFVYTEAFGGDKTNGVLAIDSLFGSEAQLSGYVDAGGQSVHFEFFTDDSRAVLYEFELWSNPEPQKWVRIGKVNALSPSLENYRLTTSMLMSLDVPWAEVSIRDGYAVSDADAFHVALYDSVVSTEVAGLNWSNHLGISETVLFP